MQERNGSALTVWTIGSLAWVILASVGLGCGNSSGGSGGRVTTSLDQWTGQGENPDLGANTTPTGDEEPTALPPQPETCDGRDNDGDGQVDNGLDAGSCVGADGEAGIMKCVRAAMRCAVCEPGATRERACHCSVTSVDLCGEDHAWVVGPCDNCKDSMDVPCGFCGYLGADGQCVNPGECEPGQSIYERCDSCPAGVDCSATTCIGRKLTCGNDCRWQANEECKPRQPECSRDEMRTGKCGECGDMAQRCDGCFWNNFGECHEQGACFVNASQTVPCGGCGDHRVATAKCNAQCQWEVSGCHGCEPGEPYTVASGCVCGGTMIKQYQCQEKSAGQCGLRVGEDVYLGTVQPCPPSICLPGQRTTVGGACQQCQGNCTWGACPTGGGDTEPPPPPPPDDCACSGTRTVSCNDACGNTRTDVCVNCAWQTGSCPPCSH